MEPLFELAAAVSPEDPTLDQEQPLDWSIYLTRIVARQVRRWREVRGISAQQLSDRTRQLGHHVPRSVITNLENHRRDAVSVAELLVLAAALDVPPVLLVAAVGHEASVTILPDVGETTWRARGWILGALAPNYSTFSPRSWQEGRHAIELFDIHRLLVTECQQIFRRIRRVAGDRELDITDFPLLEGTSTLQRQALAETVLELVYSLDKLRDHRARIQAEGFALPELPHAVALLLRESGSAGRHHHNETPLETEGPSESQQDSLLPPVIHDLLVAAREPGIQGESHPQASQQA